MKFKYKEPLPDDMLLSRMQKQDEEDFVVETRLVKKDGKRIIKIVIAKEKLNLEHPLELEENKVNDLEATFN